MTGPDSLDVIVVGGGTAGLPLAIAAAGAGARVLVIEFAPRLGGTLHYSSGQLSAAGTRLQQAKGIVDSPDAHFDDAMRICRGTADPALLRRVVDHAADTLHWLLDRGYEVMPEHPVIYFAHEPYTTPRTCFGPRKALGILDVLLREYHAAEREGHVTTWLDSEVVELLRDGTRVVGCRVRRGDGSVVETHARHVVLATGGYARHPERFGRFTGGQPLHSWGSEWAFGLGHELGLAAGGVLRHGEKFLCTFAGVRNPRDPMNVNVLTHLTPQLRQPWEVYVDLQGRRFLREDHPSVDARERALLALPQLSFWAIYDAGVANAAPQRFCFALPPDQLEGLWNHHPSFVSAASLPLLAHRLGMAPAVLLGTVDRYNAAVAAGHDADFGREHLPRALDTGPWYAILHHGLSVVGWAGLAVDPALRVLDASGAPIPGLRAVGETIGFGALNGNAFVGGMGLMPALTLGRLLGTELATT